METIQTLANANDYFVTVLPIKSKGLICSVKLSLIRLVLKEQKYGISIFYMRLTQHLTENYIVKASVRHVFVA